MGDRRKRNAPTEWSGFTRPRARASPTRPRQEAQGNRSSNGGADCRDIDCRTLAPNERQPVHEPRRLDWDEHVQDVRRRKLFRRMYRMEEHSFDKLADVLRPILERNDSYARLRTPNGAVPVKLRLAVALRMFAGASYLDVAVLFGISKESVFNIMWEVVDAIDNSPTVGPFFFPQTREECVRQAKDWEYPGIEQATTCMLPDGTGSEITGVGGGTNGPSGVEGAAADASRRKVAKEDSRKRNAALGGQDKKKRKQEKEIDNVAKVAAKSAKEELCLGEGGLGSLLGVSSSTQNADAPNSFFATTEGLETTAKKFEVQAKLRQELKDIQASIREEKALGEEADPEDLEIWNDN